MRHPQQSLSFRGYRRSTQFNENFGVLALKETLAHKDGLPDRYN